MTGADEVALALKDMRVKYIFEYPGGATVFMLNAIKRLGYTNIITMRDERNAAFAASAYAKVKYNIGVCMATSGPGATNLITGIADAWCDSIPMLAITGQVPTHQTDPKETRQVGFQYINIAGIARPITKEIFEINNAQDIYELLWMGYHEAHRDRKGPVLVDIPIDIQRNTL